MFLRKAKNILLDRLLTRLAHRSIRFRLTALYVLIFGSTLVAFSALFYRSFVNTHETEFDTALYNHAVDVTGAIKVNIFGDLSVEPGILLEGGKIFPFSIGRSFVQIRNSTGEIIAQSRSDEKFKLPLTDGEMNLLRTKRALFRDVSAGGTRYRMISYVFKKTANPFVLQLAVPMVLLEKEREALLTFLLISIPLILILATISGWHLSQRALAPVSKIIEKANRISAAQLTERVPIPEVEDEIKQLAVTLNNLLDRLQVAFESQERFIADASHQLKTPMAILRGELDLMKSKARSPEEVDSFIQSASQEVDYLSRMVEDLLLLARVSAGHAALSIGKVRLDEITLEAVSRLEAFAKLRDIKLKLNLEGTDFESQGDPELLQAMIGNLIDNAIKFSPDESNVRVKVREEGEFIQVAVSDEGPGISDEAKKRIFERFFRAESLKEKTSGMGLGLSIAQRIADVHHGRISVTNNAGQGATFSAEIKKV